MNNAGQLRKFALLALGIAIASGFVSLFLLMSGTSNSPVLAIVSASCLVIGLVLDRRAGKLDEQRPE